ncbi:MAG: trypsin-like peptidase domain-containing protein [Acidobacteriia bacterium]|nr:trypsin-like peptidase domain-containing protein [Terriglobia bacterium]
MNDGTSSGSLLHWLEQCTVRLRRGPYTGTGFFVAPGLIATCAHVLQLPRAEGQPIEVFGQDFELVGNLRQIFPEPCPIGENATVFPDVALVTVEPVQAPCVLLGNEFEIHDKLYVWGYPPERPGGDSLIPVCEGSSRYKPGSPSHHLIKMTNAQVLGGFSGAPVLNLRTGTVCGMVKRTKDPTQDIGGMAVRTELILQLLPNLIEEQRKYHYQNAQWAMRQAQLSPSRRLWYGVPAPPENVVRRSAAYDWLVGRLSGAVKEGLPLSAVQGGPGFGKTTLVAHVVTDPFIRSRFPDAVMWTTLGQSPDIAGALISWLSALGYPAERLPVPSASAKLIQLLEGRVCLLIIDDVWSPEDVSPFLAGGPGSHVLLTTRRRSVADKVKAALCEVPAMSEGEALSLFETRLARSMPDGERVQALLVAAEVGYVPLALHLAAVRAKAGLAWVKLAQDLESETRGLEALEDAHDRIKGDIKLEASLQVSLKALRADSESLWRAFLALSTLFEDVLITGSVAANLWRVPSVTAELWLEALWSEALLLRQIAHNNDSTLTTAYQMHDMIRDLSRTILTRPAPRGLNISFIQAHQELLAAYASYCADDWAHLPNDGYIHKHLLWHLERAGRVADIHELLIAERDSTNVWFEVRERLQQVAGYLADLREGMRLCQAAAEQAIDTCSSADVGGMTRYAVMQSSVQSHIDQIPVPLFEALFKAGLLSPARALEHASQISRMSQNMDTLAMIVKLAMSPWSEQALDEALRRAKTLPEERFQSYRLQQFARYLNRNQLEQAIIYVMAFQDENEKARALTGLLPRWVELGEEQLALDRILALTDEDFRSYGIQRMAPLLSEGAIRSVRSALCAFKNQINQDGALAALCERMTMLDLVDEALVWVREIKDSGALRSALVGMAPKLNCAQAQEAAILVLQMKGEKLRAEAAAAIALHLPENTRQEFIQREYNVAEGRSEAGISLISVGSEEFLLEQLPQDDSTGRAIAARWAALGNVEEALSIIESFSERTRTTALLAIADYLSVSQLDIEIDRALRNQDYNAAEVMTAALSKLGEGDRALDWASRLPTESTSVACGLMSSVLSPALLQRAWRLCQRIADEHEIWLARWSLALHDESNAWEKLVDFLGDPSFMLAVCRWLPDYCPPEPKVASTIYFYVSSVGNTKELVRLRLALAKFLEPPVRMLVTRELCSWAEGLWGLNRANGFSRLVDLLRGDEREQMSARCIRQFQSRFGDHIGVELVYSGVALLGKNRTYQLIHDLDEPVRTKAMTVLASLLERDNQIKAHRIIREWATTNPERSVIPIAQVATYAEADLLMELSAVLSSGSYQGERARLASALAAKGRWHAAMDIASTISDDLRTAQAYSSLAIHAPESDRVFCIQKAVDAGLSMITASGRERAGDRADAIAEVIPAVLSLSRRYVLDLWSKTLPIIDSHPRPEFALELARFAPVIGYLGGKASVREVSKALADCARWWS